MTDAAKPKGRHGRRALLAWSLLTLAIWLGALPWLANRPELADPLRRLDREGVDPSAIYYTELPAAERAQRLADRVRREKPGVFWRPRLFEAPAPTRQ